MHLHWKYRELVKVCMGRSSIEEIHGIARTLEAESGGILVAVEPVSKGYAIIVYRGKNYKRPATLRPQTLLSKREAMKRSKEAQRREVWFCFLSYYVFIRTLITYMNITFHATLILKTVSCKSNSGTPALRKLNS